MKTVVRVWESLQDGLAAVLLAMIQVVVLIQVVARPTPTLSALTAVTEEGARYLLAWMVLWGAVALHYADDHLRLDMVVAKFRWSVRRWVLAFGELLVGSFCAVLAVYALRSTVTAWGDVSPALGIRTAYLPLALGLSAALMVCISAGRLVRLVRGPGGAS